MEARSTAAGRHHERTVHHPDRLSGARGPLDWSNRPRSDKRYRDVQPRPLPTGFAESDAPAVAVLSGDAPSDGAVDDLAGLARLLFFADGVVRRRRLEELTLHFRAVPSAGALYPVEAYVVCTDLDGLPAGVYHFEPVTFSLQALRDGDWRALLGEAAADPQVAAAPVTVVLTGVPWRTVWKYGERGYRHLFWDAGAIVANLWETAAAVGVPARLVTGFVDQAVADLLAVATGQAPADGGEVPLALVPLGVAGDPPPPASEPPPVHLHVEPLSRRVVDEPGLWAAHRGGDLERPEDVGLWRSQVRAATTARAVPAAQQAPPRGDEPVEEVILRRGSTRRFTHATVARSALDWPLSVADRPVPSDAVAPDRRHVSALVVVHSVEGAAAGAFMDGVVRTLLHDHVSRRQTAGLCLGQPLGGDAAYTTFFMADLEALLDAGGDRAYRVAQLEAGVAAERLQLAAFAAGLGATGLTFFDDEVRTAFATRSWPLLAVAVGVPAYRARPGRRPGGHPKE